VRLPRNRSLAKVVLGRYLVFVTLCALTIALDRPWVTAQNGTWDGMAAFMAAFAAGVPWSLPILVALRGPNNDTVFVAASGAGVGLNIVLLVCWIRQK
jgi:hypothetical protein